MKKKEGEKKKINVWKELLKNRIRFATRNILKPEKSITAFSRRNAVNQIFDTMFQNDETNSKSDEAS